MNLKPYEEFSIISKLTAADAERNLAKWTMLYNPIMDRVEYVKEHSYLFEGSVTDGRFRLKTSTMNPWGLFIRKKNETIVPVIKGFIEPYDDGSLVRGRITTSYGVVIPILLIVIFEILLIALATVANGWIFIPMAIFTPLVGYLVIKFIIGSKSVHIERMLRKIFE